MVRNRDWDVVIVGAGPAGLGCALALQACGVGRMVILDRDEVGASFARWPKQMRLITPSFHSNPFRQADLNAINPKTSPADFMHGEHPTGREYAMYLRAVAGHYELPVESGVEVRAVLPRNGGFFLQTSRGGFRARFVIWAAGEFGHPDTGGIQGANLCRHNSRIADWKTLKGGEFTLIGGYESGMDAAVNLSWLGKKVHLLSRGEPWHLNSPDPSRSLSPYTRDRLKEALLNAPGSIQFYKNADVKEITKIRNSYFVIDRDGAPFETPTAPILCTGFKNALGGVREWFAEEYGEIQFSEEADESTITPGLFYSGPALTHRHSLFCFIYKFRSRFGIVARAIAQRLGLEWAHALQPWQEHGFMLDDLGCCTDCRCAVAATSEETPEVRDFAEITRAEEVTHA